MTKEENKKTNIAEFLLNAPKGLTLYSPIVGNVIFDEVKNRTWDKEEVTVPMQVRLYLSERKV